MAQNQPDVINNAALADPDMFSDARLEMIRNQVGKGAPPDVFAAMVDIAKRRGLDPLAKQISLISFKGTWTIITTIDGYRAIAEKTGQYVGSDAPVFTYSNETTKAGRKAPDTATVTVHKLINGNAYPFSATVYFEEYSTGMNNWSTMPRTMLAKVAESHALRKAFPAVTSGMYEESEMDQAIEGTARVVNTDRQQVDRQTGEITATAEQSASDKPSAMKRLHAVAAANGITHDDLHRQALAVGRNSLADYDANTLNKTAYAIEQRPDAAKAYYANLVPDEEPAPEAPPEDATQSSNMDDINAAVGAAYDAQYTEGGE